MPDSRVYGFTDSIYYSEIADAIRSKAGTTELYEPSKMGSAIRNIPSGGGSDDNFKIKCGAMSGSVYDTQASVVGSYGLYHNNGITGIEMPNVETIRESAFEACGHLEYAIFPKCNMVDLNAFTNCGVLSYIEFPKCSEIHHGAFFNCRSLVNVSFPECSSLSTSVFCYCSNLTSISFPVCEYLGGNAFISCINLSEINFPVCSSIGFYAFSNCRGLVSINIPACEYIGSNAFRDCINLVSLSPLSVCKNISSYAFYNCSKLSEINIPACEYIGSGAFTSCDLRIISAPECSYIGVQTFFGNTKLSAVYILSSSIVSLTSPTAFGNTPISDSTYLGYFGSIYVPTSLADAYKVANNWSLYADKIVGI